MEVYTENKNHSISSLYVIVSVTWEDTHIQVYPTISICRIMGGCTSMSNELNRSIMMNLKVVLTETAKTRNINTQIASTYATACNNSNKLSV